ncbi:MAG: serine/threonine protein kinase [Anaerolineaceae bacterium]|nr:MAG: serine/threonine protein kinase [Anaerolineaceae bacterium]
MTDLENTVLSGRYELRERLGVGGMAYVYRALDRNLQREVAIKILRDSLIDDPSFQTRFLQEGRAAANLTHPNIVTIYDFGYDQNRYFLVMEFINGTDLKTLIVKLGQLELNQAVDLMIQISSGVGYAHRAGLVHCDLKPQNVLVTHDGRAKITDFGIARALATIRPDEHSEIVWGSPIYFSPEQSAGDPPSPASDVYALGVVFFEMLTGRPPFEGTDATSLAELHQITPPPLPRDLNPFIPKPIEDIILKVLSKEPSARYRTADQLCRVLETFSAQPLETLTPPTYLESPEIHYPSEAQPKVSFFTDQIDWIAVFLGLIAFLALGGLIPLWLWVCLLYPSCPIQPW